MVQYIYQGDDFFARYELGPILFVATSGAQV
jgi:hypothetical protein